MAQSIQRQYLSIFGTRVSTEKELYSALLSAERGGLISADEAAQCYRQYAEFFMEQDRWYKINAVDSGIYPNAPDNVSSKEKEEEKKRIEEKNKLKDLIAHYYRK